MFFENIRRNNEKYLLIILLFFISFFFLYKDPYIASGLAITPDSTEYALAAHSYVTEGSYKILVDRQWLPPRYPPWFSIFVIAPVYSIFGLEIGNAIFPITAFAILGVIFAFCAGRSIGGSLGGIFSAFALLSMSEYRFGAGLVMTDVPATAILILILILFLRLVRSSEVSCLYLFCCGVLIAIVSLFRPVFLSSILPFCIYLFVNHNRRIFIIKSALISFPILVGMIMTFLYNYYVFGSVLRNGYKFWVAVPLDYLNLTFSINYISQNILVFLNTEFYVWAGLIFLFYVLLRIVYFRGKLKSDNDINCVLVKFNWAMLFALSSLTPMLLFYLLYFFLAERFFLPVSVLLAIVAGGLFGIFFRRYNSFRNCTVTVVFLSICVYFFVDNASYIPYKRIAVDEINKLTPENSLIISGIEPAYIEYLTARDGQRKIIPVSRNVEYAGKLITPQKVVNPNPAPLNWQDHRCEGLLNGGAKEAVSTVVADNFQNLSLEISEGRRVFIEMILIKAADKPIIEQLLKKFKFIPLSKTLYELTIVQE